MKWFRFVRRLSSVLAAFSLFAFLLGAPLARGVDVLITPEAITSSTAGTDLYGVTNLINGSGFSGTPALTNLGTHADASSSSAWVTTANAPDYYTALQAPVLTCALPQTKLHALSELVIWGYAPGGFANANEAKVFAVSFSSDGTNFAGTVTVTSSVPLAANALRLPFPAPHDARHVRVTITDNHYPVSSGGDRVGLGELRFVGPLIAGTRFASRTGSQTYPFTNWVTAATNIQDAVDAALPGDLVLVSNGVYQTGGRVSGVNGELLTNRVVIDKAVTVQSVNGPGVTTIQGAGPVGDAAVRCAYVGSNAMLTGFTLANGATRSTGDTSREKSGGGVWCATNGVVNDCILVGNVANADGGGSYGGTLNACVLSGNSAGSSGGGSANGALNGCTLSTNSAGSYGGGAYNGTLNNCLLWGNSAGYGGGGSQGGTLINCTLSGNRSDQYGGGSYGGTLNNCIVYFNTAPDGSNYTFGTINYSCTTPLPAGPGNLTSNPQFVNAAARDFHLLDASPCRDAGNNTFATNSATDLDGNPRIADGLVDMGAYERPSIRYVATNGNDAADGHSWAAAKQTIQAAIDLTLPGDTVIVSNGVYATGGRVVDGAMTNRVAITNAITVRSANGPGVTIIRGAKNPLTTNGNAAVRCVYVGTNATLIGFTLTNGATRAAGGTYLEQSGGGVFCVSTAAVYNCILSGNSANNYGGASIYGTLNNCILLGNTALYGGGSIYSDQNNCTVSGNSAQYGGGGVYYGTLNNCIVYFNAAPSGPNYTGSGFDYSCTAPLPPGGSGNITNDPMFVATNDFHLTAVSPCINAGSNGYVTTTTDLDGKSRIREGTVDMGAFEQTTASSAGTRYVNILSATPVFPFASWTNAATSIQDAVDAAWSSDTILVSNGVYATGGRTAGGGALTNRVVIDKTVSVRSVNGPAVTTIRGAGPDGNAAVRCVWMTNGAVLLGFTLTNGATLLDLNSDGFGGGVYAQSSSATIGNCTLSGNSARSYGGGSFYGTLNNCTLSGNSAGYNGGGSAGSTLNNCVLTGNAAGSYGGGSYGGWLNNCTLSGNNATYGGGSSGGSLYNCVVYFNTASTSNNHYGSTLSYSCTTPLPAGTGNITNDPQFVATNDYHLSIGSPCRDIGDNTAASGTTDLDGNPRIHNTVVDMGAYELTSYTSVGNRYVNILNTTPAFPFASWATAATNIQDAVDAAQPNDLVLVANGVYATGGRTAGGGALTNRVVIDRAVTVRSANGPAVTTIRGTKDPLTTNGDAAVRCVWMINGATLAGFTLTNGATRTSGDADRDGGGLFAQSASVTVSNCVFTGSSASDDGGGAYGGTLNNCWFIRNAGGYGGGAGFFLHPGTLNNCALTGNSANLGGGTYAGTLNNCTLTGNSANSGGGTIGGTLNNCIVYFNTSPSGSNYYSGTFSYTCTTPLPAGTGNITNDPQFVATNDFHLAAGSPCRDTGNSAAVFGITDLDGNLRIANGTVDMGAYELQSVSDPDADGDGFSNADEAIVGTNPSDSNSYWKVTGILVPSSLMFNSVTGRIYAADYIGNLAATPQIWVEFTNNIPGTGNSIVIPTPAVTNHTYRIRVQLAP